MQPVPEIVGEYEPDGGRRVSSGKVEMAKYLIAILTGPLMVPGNRPDRVFTMPAREQETRTNETTR